MEPRVSRRAKKSTIKTGRVIGEKREKLETASERAAARSKVKRRERRRLIITVIGFIIVTAVIVVVAYLFIPRGDEPVVNSNTTTIIVPYAPTIEVVDEDSGTGTAQLTSRMKEYIGQAEADFRELGYTPVKAVIPAGAIREVDFYLDGVSGFIKLTVDRGTGVSAEDADRMLRYLARENVPTFEYVDVRLDGKAYWK